MMLFGSTVSAKENWLQWRSRDGRNHAPDGTRLPTRWNFESGQNLVWKTPLPGRGHSTPVFTDQFIFLTTADVSSQTQSLLRLDRESGRLLENTVLHRGTLPARIHSQNTHASPSPAIADEHVFVAFHTDDSIVLSKVSFDGAIRWQRRVSGFQPVRYQFGYGASPIIEDDSVIVAAEYDGPDSGLYALETGSGKLLWKRPRPQNLSFSSPVIANLSGRREVLLPGASQVASYDPQTGRPYWSVDAGTGAHCGTAVWDDRRVIVSGGYPDRGTWCVMGAGGEKLLWNTRQYAYEQTPLVVAGTVYIVADNGIASALRTIDGKSLWQERIFSGGVSASPLLVGQWIVAANERGRVVVFKASPDRCEVMAEIDSGDAIFATPVALEDRLYLRSVTGTGDTAVDHLVAIGN